MPTHEEIARTCHEVNRVFCEYLGDSSQQPWEFAAPEIKESAINGVEFVLMTPGAPDSASHENWCQFKLNQGWTYGPLKDEVAKTHPCLVAFEELPPEQQMKDRFFRTVVLSMAEVSAHD